MPVSSCIVDSIAVINFTNPPVNSLGLTTRSAIASAVQAALANPAAIGIVLTGGNSIFSAGADIREFESGLSGDAFASPTLGEVVGSIAESTKPVVALIHGACLGGGFELALACHRRIVGRDATFALPEVRLGLIPGAGGTQRLPRLIGVEAALDLILSGNTIDAVQAVALGIAQQGSTVPLSTALDLAKDVSMPARIAVSTQSPARLTEGLDRGAYFAARRAKVRRPLPAPLQCLKALELSTQTSLADGLRAELSLFRELMETPESLALRYAFFSDRAAGQIRGIASNLRQRPITRVAVIGAGVMGRGIALCAAGANLPVTLIDASAAALQHALVVIQTTYDGFVAKGRITADKATYQKVLITTTVDMASVQDADLIIEAVYEDLATKQAIFRVLDERAKPGAILASNTSALDINQIAATTRRPQDVVGMHFFSPANVMRLLEVVRAEHTAPEVLTTVMSFAKTVNKIAVVAGVCDGFIGNRMFEEYLRQAGFLLDEGALPLQVDQALESWGMAMGPFAVMDLAGGDIAWAIRRRRAVDQPDRAYSTLPDRLYELGRYGQKTRSGFYKYGTAGHQREPDPAVDALVAAHSHQLGITRRTIGESEIVTRCILALVNEGAQLLDEGIAQRASDIDVVYRNGYGFPAERGGPMFYADRLGLPVVLEAMRGFQAGYHGEFWRPARLLTQCAAEKVSLAAANGVRP